MTKDTQKFEIDLSFLKQKKYQVHLMEDTINFNKNAEDYRFSVSQVSKPVKQNVKMNRVREEILLPARLLRYCNSSHSCGK